MSDTEEPTDSGGYSPDQVKHFLDRLQELRNAQPAVQIDLSYLSERLTVKRAKTFANEAMGRRLPVINRSVLNIYDIYPPNRKEFLTRDECSDVAIQLHAFAINVYAILDNAAWVCMLEAGGNLPPVKVSLFKKECQAFMPAGFVEYISQPTVKKWFADYGKVYRDSTAHRIPPYLPDRNYTSEESVRWQKLNEESMALLLNWKPGETHEQVNERIAKSEQLNIEKDGLGRNSLFIALTLTGEDAAHPIYLHPQILCDWGLVQEFVQAFTQAMRQHYGWEAPRIPPMVVN